jgi:hypothetical protein
MAGTSRHQVNACWNTSISASNSASVKRSSPPRPAALCGSANDRFSPELNTGPSARSTTIRTSAGRLDPIRAKSAQTVGSWALRVAASESVIVRMPLSCDVLTTGDEDGFSASSYPVLVHHGRVA